MQLVSDRLELTAATAELVRAELEAPEALAVLLGARVEPGWPPGDYDRAAQEFFLERLATEGPSSVGWYSWYAVRRGDAVMPATLVGAGGYFGPPDDQGMVEIGFSIMPAWRGMGYATELAGVLVKTAFSDSRVRRVTARTAPENLASRTVLERCGLCLVGRDSDSGSDRFEILRRPLP